MPQMQWGPPRGDRRPSDGVAVVGDRSTSENTEESAIFKPDQDVELRYFVTLGEAALRVVERIGRIRAQRAAGGEL